MVVEAVEGAGEWRGVGVGWHDERLLSFSFMQNKKEGASSREWEGRALFADEMIRLDFLSQC